MAIFRRTQATWLITGVLAICCLGSALLAQQGNRNPQQRRPGPQAGGGPGAGGGGGRNVRLPEDPRLLDLHKTFADGAMKLAQEYETANQLDKAKACYAEVLRLVPNYPPAQQGIEKIDTREATADRKVVDVHANKAWQDSGVALVQGKPVNITATGNWGFKMSYTLGPDGIEIPRELRDFNLGALVGIIVDENGPEDARPFYIGAESKFRAPKSGKLFLRMYDSDPADNTGKISVNITGTFAK